MSRMPPSDSSSLSRSRVSWSTSFLVSPCVSPESCSSSAFMRLIDCEIVFQLVSIPPSQRWLTKCRSEEHTSELQSLMRISYAVFCLKKKQQKRSKIFQREQQCTTTEHIRK